MSVFNHIDQQRVDSILGLIQSCENIKYKPVFKAFDGTVLKSIHCARLLVEWQNHLQNCMNDPNSQIILDVNEFNDFIVSQKLLNKTKRQLSKLFIEGMPNHQLEELTTQASSKLGIEIIYPSSALLPYLFKFQGDDAICLETIGEHAGHRLSSPSVPIAQRVAKLGELKEDETDGRVFLTVASAVEHFPLASNAWGYRGQGTSSFFHYSLDKSEAAHLRLDEFRKKCAKTMLKTPWNKCIARESDSNNNESIKIFRWMSDRKLWRES